MVASFATAFALTVSGLSLQTHQIDPRQLRCLSEAIYFEAGDQSYQGKVAVANVVVKRSKDQETDFCKVIKQPKQFSYFRQGPYKRQRINMADPRTILAMRHSVTVAYAATQNRLRDVTNGASYYINPRYATDVKWTYRLVKTAIIGNHHFFKEKKKDR